MWKDYFYFSKKERQGIILLSVLIVICLLIRIFSPFDREVPPYDYTEFEEKYGEWFSSLPPQQEQRERTVISTKKEILLKPFDPNQADSLTLVSLGLPGWMAGNVLQYRRKGGSFKKREDFRKIYGLSEEKYEELYPYIEIRREETPVIEMEAKEEVIAPVALIEKPFKYEKGTLVELNRADTTELKKIPGIGSVYARRIVSYRNRLGGFYTTEQLKEIELEADSLMQWFTVDTTAITKLNINTVSLERLRNHPYINFYQARVFIEHRRKRGKILNPDQFRLYEEFTEEELEKITHYISFN